MEKILTFPAPQYLTLSELVSEFEELAKSEDRMQRHKEAETIRHRGCNKRFLTLRRERSCRIGKIPW